MVSTHGSIIKMFEVSVNFLSTILQESSPSILLIVNLHRSRYTHVVHFQYLTTKFICVMQPFQCLQESLSIASIKSLHYAMAKIFCKVVSIRMFSYKNKRCVTLVLLSPPLCQCEIINKINIFGFGLVRL